MKYTKEDILLAAKIGEVSVIDAEHIISLLDEARNINHRNDFEYLKSILLSNSVIPNLCITDIAEIYKTKSFKKLKKFAKKKLNDSTFNFPSV